GRMDDGFVTTPRNPSRISAATVAVLLLVAACAGNGEETTPTAPSEITSGTSPSTVATTEPPPNSSDPPEATTPTSVPPSACEGGLAEMLAAVDDSIAAARLDSGGSWVSETATSSFDDRTHGADEFGYRTGLDCTARLAQTTPGGGDRLVLAAWTGERRAWVVQASDAPADPYRAEQRVQLFIGQPDGEWLVEQAVWAGSLETGETVIVGTVDLPFGVTAKAWWAEVPRFDDLEVSNDTEQYAIDTLVAAGARNVSVAEPASFQSEMGSIQFVTPLGLHLVAVVAPPEGFDPAAPIVEGEMTVQRVGDVEVFVTSAAPTSYAVGSVGWTCGDRVWFIDSSYGTVDELLDWAAQVIEAAGC
ncbi:MAG TPA: hypothetical protein VK860_10300, partial [Ilumatobacteraceae bacterium]|nr:hypothetical protein [Ilumatobacteraceae bacterium]